MIPELSELSKKSESANLGSNGLGLCTNEVHTDVLEWHQGAGTSMTKSDLHFFGGWLSLFNTNVSTPLMPF